MAMHLASLFARPQVALFGPTNPFHWRPRHAQARVLLAGVDAHAKAFSPKEKKRDMKLISTQAVVDATRSLRSPV
jgi:ADP-heptose:LPS heptosyltransferase